MMDVPSDNKKRKLDSTLNLSVSQEQEAAESTVSSQSKSSEASEVTHPFTLRDITVKTLTEEAAVKFAQELGLIPSKGFCPNCDRPISQINVTKQKGGTFLRQFSCREKNCRKSNKFRVTIKSGTFFSNLRYSVAKALTLIYCFSHKFSHAQAVHESSHIAESGSTSSETVSDMYSYLREVCLKVNNADSGRKQIGGANYTVEIDKLKLGGQWVFGGICRETKECFMVPLEDKAEETVLRLIKEHIEPGTIIHSTCCSTYSTLAEEGYNHQTVNRAENFVDPNTKASINLIESTWWSLKRSLPRLLVRKTKIHLHLGEYMWRRKTTKECDRFLALVEAIKSIYSGPSHP